MNEKVKIVHSIKAKVCSLVNLAVIVAGLLMMVVFLPSIQKQIREISQNYISDLSFAYGSTLDNEIKKADGKADSVLKPDNLSLKLDGVGLEGVESSYVYVADQNGTMIYHPVGSKIGRAVEDKVVKNMTDELKAGKKVENTVLTSDFEGESKYTAVYVSTYGAFVLVVTANESEVLKPIRVLNYRGLGGMVFAMLFCGIVGYFFAGFIINPIKRITKATSKIANMDFTQDSDAEKLNRRKDEVGSMNRALTTLRQELVHVVGNIKDQSGVLMEASEVLSQNAGETAVTMSQVELAVNEISQGASTQAGETQKATENVVIMGNMVEETDEVVNALVDYAERMQQSSNNAKSILSQLEKVNKETEQYIDEIAGQTATTNLSAIKINEAASMITEIAEETNLLSLNASIEAARAGEQGRGFAVVASQIQKLAEQSNDSAREIGNIIQILLQDSQKAVTIMEDVKKIMSEQSEHVGRTDEAFEEIQEGVNKSILGMKHISEKTGKMDEARVNVVDVVQNLTAIAQENAASAEETSASVTEVSSIISGISDRSEKLRKIAQELEEGMDIFKL